MEQERWERHQEQEDEANLERLKEESKSRLIGLIISKWSEGTLAEALGGGVYGRMLAEMITRIKCDLPLDDPPQADKPDSSVTMDAVEHTGSTDLADPTTQDQSR